MLVASEISAPAEVAGPGLGSGLAGNAAIQRMQQSLQRLALASGWTAANPGIISGVIDAGTVRSLQAVTHKLISDRLLKIPSSVSSALTYALALAMSVPQFKSQVDQYVGTYATQIGIAVDALAAKYSRATGGPPMPVPQFPPITPGGSAPPPAPVPVAVTGPLPRGTVQARSKKTGMWRVAVPQAAASSLGGPSVSLGAAFHELPPRAIMTTGIPIVSEGDLDKKVGEGKWFSNPWILGGIGAGVLALGGGFWYMRRR